MKTFLVLSAVLATVTLSCMPAHGASEAGKLALPVAQTKPASMPASAKPGPKTGPKTGRTKSAQAQTTQSIGADAFENFGRFGQVAIYRPKATPKQVVLFLSGDGGWNLGVIEMAKQLRDQGALVAGISTPHYLQALEKSTEGCAYPPAEFEQFSHYLQAKEAIKSYIYPIIAGYSSGATLVYGALVQAPQGTFAGGLSLGFCPDLELSKPLCPNGGLKPTPRGKAKGVNLNAVPALHDPWQVLQGASDEVCPAAATMAFIKPIKRAEVVLLAKVGHGYSVENHWLPQYLAAYQKLSQAPQNTLPPAPKDLAGLPIIEVPTRSVNSPASDTLVILLTGDGGWAGLDQELADAFVARDLPVVALNSLKYFWTPRTPEQTASDVERIASFYLRHWQKQRLLLVGYSQGADVLPFVLNRFSSAMRSRVIGASAIGLGEKASFEFHVSHWLSDGDDGLPIKPEIAKLQALKLRCIYGTDESDSLCRSLTNVEKVSLPGGHHFNGDYARVAAAVFAKY
jgi:type IV secretory pathway VirJ component